MPPKGFGKSEKTILANGGLPQFSRTLRQPLSDNNTG